ncbi:terpenoid synthase [Xylariales sp. AK1849]|nr:terpenoid synthase [Xylariales sp. AK1849]
MADTWSLVQIDPFKKDKRVEAEPEYFYMPNLLRDFDWNRGLNPHYKQAKAESDAWLEGLRPFNSLGHKIYNGWDFCYLAAASYPKSSFFTFRSCCDLMNTFFVIDEQTDNQPIDDVIERCEMAMDAVLHPDLPRPEGECVIGEITRQYWKRASMEIPKAVIERFERTWRCYLNSVIRQARNRSRRTILAPEAYILERRDNIGTWPSYPLGEQCWNLDIPHEAAEHPFLETMRGCVSELVTLQNDLCSYRKERLTGDCDYNIITVVMEHMGLDLTGAVQWASDRHDCTLAKFMETRDNVITKTGFPSWGPELDSQIAEYTGVLADWIRGNYEWSFYTQRYFPGDMGVIAKKTGKIVIA